MSNLRVRAMLMVVTFAVSLICYGALHANEPEHHENETPHDAPYQSSGEHEEHARAIKLEGKGRQATHKFEFREGLAVVDVRNDGKENFIVELMNDHGDSAGNLFNEIGKFHGRKAFHVPKDGEYLFDVQATAGWTFSVTQPTAEEVLEKPQTFTGEGMNISPFIKLPAGLTVFEFERHGSGRGAFILLNEAGQPVEQIANQLDSFQGSKPVKIQEGGVYLLNVYGEGNWSVKVE